MRSRVVRDRESIFVTSSSSCSSARISTESKLLKFSRCKCLLEIEFPKACLSFMFCRSSSTFSPPSCIDFLLSLMSCCEKRTNSDPFDTYSSNCTIISSRSRLHPMNSTRSGFWSWVLMDGMSFCEPVHCLSSKLDGSCFTSYVSSSSARTSTSSPGWNIMSPSGLMITLSQSFGFIPSSTASGNMNDASAKFFPSSSGCLEK
mmetsp:Transcript_31201/g.50259  ORF Transcript_31201/g.50259 Transcript_31201/m.50259 type:complete len:203 (+) Transcript_31201:120-728(+)